MDLVGWIIGYMILFALLHLILYYVYVRREDGEQTRTPSFADPDRGRSNLTPGSDHYPRAPDDVDEIDDTDGEHDVDGETIRCPHCGAHNAADQTFTYCWRCISTLRH
ncbi:DUF7577 domain-containing protein [Natrialba swarupiae]|uniref:DUF7577 domain-containing protein n=1 Tax=Natrialba swarupiae TaxID=2448032 RepID=A0A5D5ALV9_9EURY|nr:hypothetical protein [Natrialba swarupiae]TYT62789.1 hypothetical protein FYC77_07085 [Natrialba swarupiae]